MSENGSWFWWGFIGGSGKRAMRMDPLIVFCEGFGPLIVCIDG